MPVTTDVAQFPVNIQHFLNMFGDAIRSTTATSDQHVKLLEQQMADLVGQVKKLQDRVQELEGDHARLGGQQQVSQEVALSGQKQSQKSPPHLVVCQAPFCTRQFGFLLTFR